MARKRKKKDKQRSRSWRRLAAGGFAFIAFGYIGFAIMLNSAVRKGLEVAGPRVAGVETRVEAVRLSPFTGRGEATGLFVGNPEGFKAPAAIEVGRATISLKPTTVFSDKIIVRSVRLEAPVITLEGKLGGNNLSQIVENITETIGAGLESLSGGPARLQVAELVIADARVKLGLTALGGKSVSVPLPEIRLEDLGAGPEGITVGELAREVLNGILREIPGAAAGAMGRLGQGAIDAVKSIGDRVGDAKDRAKRLFRRD